MSFAHLHVHTDYSLLDGFSNVKKLTQRVKEMGMPAVAITDHGTMFGVIEFYNAAKAAGVKPIIGLEAYMAARTMKDRDPKLDRNSTHLLLLAENETGYRNLLKIASAAQLEGMYYYPRIDHDFLAAHAEGLICTSGCMAAEIPEAILRENPEEAVRRINWYYDVFGPDRFFLELQQHDIPEILELNRKLVELGARYSAKFVATNDVHYIEPEDYQYQDILLAIQTNTRLDDKERMRMTDSSYYLRTPEEMGRIFAEVPQALSNTLLIAERCNVDLGFKGYHLPEFPVPEGHTAQTYLRALCEEGLARRYGERAARPEVRERLEYELSVIHQMGFDAYFLIVWDLCRHARESGIWYNARGSAAGSIVAYALDITLVDPLQHGLLFERFLNPGRREMPDIDLDFRDDRRAEMLEYCARKYGDDKVAQIITFGTMGTKAALRDVARVKGVELSLVDRVAKLVPFVSGRNTTMADALAVPEFKKIYDTDPQMREIIDIAAKMEGTIRNAGTHAAGVVISDKPLTEYLPLHRPTSNSEETPIKTVTQFEMGILSSLGMLKVDFLGLITLTVMAKACDLIKRRHGKEFNLHNIPLDDPKAFELLGAGNTAGLFQVEGSGMTRYLVQMKPQTVEHVIAMVALFRPGPMAFIPDYIARMHGEAPIEYRHEALRPIYETTYGIPVYQEQLMRAAIELGGYTPSEADELRSAISKKKAKEIEKHRAKFVAGAMAKGMDKSVAEAIYSDWEEFARYGFNRCLPGDVEVLDASTGRLVKIEDLYRGRAEIKETVSCDIPSLELHNGRVTAVMDNGVKPVFRLTTALGRVIEATENHPFYTPHGWRQLGELQVDEFIGVPRYIPVEGKNEWPEHEVIALGHLLAEGNLCHPHSVYFYSQDEQQAGDFIRAAESFENVNCTVATHKSTYSVYAARADKRFEPGIFTWAGKLGLLGKNARTKEIPPPAFELNNRQIGLMLSRMWEGDGHVDESRRNLYYATASKRLAGQIQHLLLRFGIVSRVRTVEFPYKEGRVGYQVFITGYENFLKFAEHIGCHFINPKRRDAIRNLALRLPPEARGTKDIVPAGAIKGHVRAAKEQSGLTWTALTQITGIAPREFYPTNSAGKVGFRRNTLLRLGNYFDDPQIKRYAESDLYWDRIVSIEYAGEKQTYDLEVEDSHNFVANDILVHNSHAADYGVIAVETAYLKAHYPAEYMTALLSASKNQTEKVAYYVADARAMGVPVLPPDINASGWDFEIEDRADPSTGSGQAAPAIRFGLGAVKNVGEAAVNLIVEARRKGGPFKDLNDLAARVDLRAVGKRALECLIKVGALDAFGGRAALLAGLDRLVAVSSAHFRAAEAGQMSLFGAATGVVEQVRLPDVREVDRREALNWERELVGMYVSDHPLTPYQKILSQLVNYFSAQLGEASHEERVRVAGSVESIRPFTTKAGKPMGFVTIEDIQGAIELVLFPKTWEKFQPILQQGKIILAEGKVDATNTPPKILVDNIRTDFSLTVPADEALPAALRPREISESPRRIESFSASRTAPVQKAVQSPKPILSKPAPARTVAESKPGYPAGQIANLSNAGQISDLPYIDKDTPPPPENFPAGWEDEWQPSFDEAVIAARPEPRAGRTETPTHSRDDIQAHSRDDIQADDRDAIPTYTAGEEFPLEEIEPAPQSRIEPTVGQIGNLSHAPVPPPVLPSLYVPLVEPKERERPPQQITLLLRPSGDKEVDKRRIKTLYGTLISFHGRDRFSFQIFENGRGHLIDFPNDTTRICPELLSRLRKVIGEESWRIEPILLQ